jgi:hypothetical protein
MKESLMSDTKRRREKDPLEKFADVISPDEYRRVGIRRHLPTVNPYRQHSSTPELEERREAESQFRIKKAR